MKQAGPESRRRDMPIAYVTARYPPMQSSGTFRVEAVMRYLPGLGFQPTVVTLPPGWVRQQSGSARLAQAIGPEPGVLRPSAPSDPLVRVVSRTPVARRLLRHVAVPDLLVYWARRIPARVAPRLEGVRLVYVTSPPFSAMVAGAALAERLGVPCVQELRDPPSFNRRLRGRAASFIRRMRAFEADHLSRAEAVIVVTPGMRRELLRLHPHLDQGRMHVVTNGYPVLEADPARSGRDPDRFTITYVGSFQGGVPQRADSLFTPEVVLPALARLPGPAVLRLVGPVTPAQRAGLEARWPADMLQFVGRVPRRQALAEMAAADACLVVSDEDPWWIGRKVFEYQAYGRRILAVVPEGDTADLLRKSGKSLVVPLGDAAGLERAIRMLFESAPTAPAPAREVSIPTDADCVEGIARVLRSVL